MTLAYYGLGSRCRDRRLHCVLGVARTNAAAVWLIPGVVSLMAFAWLLTRIDVAYAGRAYAAYGGIYIVASLSWMWLVEARAPDRWDVLGNVICLGGAMVILYGPRAG